MITGLNHITLAVSDLDISLQFYHELLGFQLHARWRKGAYLSAGSVWLCLSCGEVSVSTDYTHIAFSVAQADFESFSDRLSAQGIKQWQENKSEGDSLYFLDPDGHKLELHIGGLHSRLESMRSRPYEDMKLFD